MSPTPTIIVRVAGVEDLAPDVRAFTLVDATAARLPAFSPGAHVVVHTPGGRRRRNAYSLACSPLQDDAYRIAVRLEPDGRGGSRALHEHVARGDLLAIEPPHNLFAPVRAARRHVLVAGGIGITPFVAYVHALGREGTPFELHYAFRAPGHGAFVDELADLAPAELRTYVDAGGAELLEALQRDVLFDQPLGTHLSVCGPAPMIDAVLALARAAGWPQERLHVERFSTATGPMEPFAVELGRRGEVVPVGADVTLLEALEQAGVELPYLCRQGVCGECRVPVLAGRPDHRDLFLGPEERDRAVMPCVSRCAEGPLVLDL